MHMWTSLVYVHVQSSPSQLLILSIGLHHRFHHPTAHPSIVLREFIWSNVAAIYRVHPLLFFSALTFPSALYFFTCIFPTFLIQFISATNDMMTDDNHLLGWRFACESKNCLGFQVFFDVYFLGMCMPFVG